MPVTVPIPTSQILDISVTHVMRAHVCIARKVIYSYIYIYMYINIYIYIYTHISIQCLNIVVIILIMIIVIRSWT